MMAGELLKKLRIEKGLTQTQLAVRANLSLSIIQKMEKAKAVGGRRSTWRRAVEQMERTLEEFEDTARGNSLISLAIPLDLREEIARQAKSIGVNDEQWAMSAILAVLRIEGWSPGDRIQKTFIKTAGGEGNRKKAASPRNASDGTE